VLAKGAEEERSALHRSGCVISHSCNCRRIGGNRNIKSRLLTPQKGISESL
jgi:hypothetical protein